MNNKYLFFLCGTLLLLSSCRYTHRRRVSGDGPSITEQRNLSAFTGVETRGSVDIYVSQGPFNVKVVADQSLVQYIETTVENGHLLVRFRPGISIGDYHDAKVYVTAPELNDFETHGSGDINGEGKISNTGKADVQVSGSGDIELQLDCPAVTTATNGSGNISLKGETKTIHCGVTGSGDVKMADLKAETVQVSIHGSGDAEVFASESLDVEVFGSGDVHYRGDPKINTSVHGSGEVSKMD